MEENLSRREEVNNVAARVDGNAAVSLVVESLRLQLTEHAAEITGLKRCCEKLKEEKVTKYMREKLLVNILLPRRTST